MSQYMLVDCGPNQGSLMLLQLADNSLEGTFPATWDYPLSLKELSFDNNKLSGKCKES